MKIKFLDIFIIICVITASKYMVVSFKLIGCKYFSEVYPLIYVYFKGMWYFTIRAI